jgi:hypothetical protein
LLSELIPHAKVIALLVNPIIPATERGIRDMQEAARPMIGLTGEPSRPMAVDLTGAAAAAVVVLEPEQWTDAIGCAVDEYEACLVEWRPDMPPELARSIKFRLHSALLGGLIALGRVIRRR